MKPKQALTCLSGQFRGHAKGIPNNNIGVTVSRHKCEIQQHSCENQRKRRASKAAAKTCSGRDRSRTKNQCTIGEQQTKNHRKKEYIAFLPLVEITFLAACSSSNALICAASNSTIVTIPRSRNAISVPQGVLGPAVHRVSIEPSRGNLCDSCAQGKTTNLLAYLRPQPKDVYTQNEHT